MPSVLEYTRPGAYPEFMTRRTTTVPPSAGAIVAVAATDDYGPVETPKLFNSWAEYLEVARPLNPATPTDGYIAVYNAFRGETTESPGAGAVLFFRLAGVGVAKAARTLNNTAGTPAPALTLTAKYEGTRANNLSLTVAANAAVPATQIDLLVLDGTTQVESYRGYTSAQIDKLRDDINLRSKWLDASAAVNGFLLGVGSFALTGGNSGTTLLAGDYTAWQTALETQRFGYAVPYNLTDTSIQASMRAWAIGLNSKQKAKKFFLGQSGASGEAYSAAATRSQASNNENIFNFHLPLARDTRLGVTLTGAQLLPRIAGILAARGGRSGLTFANLEDIEILQGPADADILSALVDGVITAETAEVGTVLSKGLTTYTSNPTDKPKDIYSRIKYVTTMHGIYRRSRERNEGGDKIGKLNVNNDTREALLADLKKDIDTLTSTGEVQPGAELFARVSSDPPPSDNDEFVILEWGGRFARELSVVVERIFLS